MSDNMAPAMECVVERIFDAPAETIWQMWTDSEHFKKWYGPQGFTIPVAQIDAQVGGKRLVCMSSPDGSKKMWSTGEHMELTPHTRLVYTESPSDENGNVISPQAMGMPEGFPTVTTVTVELEEVDGKTKMVLIHAGVPEQAAGGWGQAFAKLADYLAG